MKKKETLKTLLHYFGLVLMGVCVCVSLSGCSLAAKVIKGMSTDIAQDIAEDMTSIYDNAETEVSEEIEEKEETGEPEVNPEASEELNEEEAKEPEETKESEWGEFEGFLFGDESAVVDEKVNLGYDDYNSENCGKSFTLDELNNYMIYSEYYTHNPSIYAYLMKKDDGNVLLLKYDGMDIYCEDDDSFVIFALVMQKDGLHITYDVESWCRSVVEVNDEGIVYSSGSGGAGDHIADKGYLDEKGLYNEIFYVEECGSGWINGMFNYYLDSSFSTETKKHAFEVDLEDNNIVALYTMDGQIYGTIEYGDTEAASALVESAEEDGVIWVDATEIDGLIEEYEEALGLSDAMDAGEPEWVIIKEAEAE